MSRVAKAPITIPEGVNITQEDGLISVKGKLGEMTMHVNSSVQISTADNVLTFAPNDVTKKEEKAAWAQAGTARANTANLIKGVTEGWEKKLTLIGVGYRAQAKGKVFRAGFGTRSKRVGEHAPKPNGRSLGRRAWGDRVRGVSSRLRSASCRGRSPCLSWKKSNS